MATVTKIITVTKAQGEMLAAVEATTITTTSNIISLIITHNTAEEDKVFTISSVNSTMPRILKLTLMLVPGTSRLRDHPVTKKEFLLRIELLNQLTIMTLIKDSGHLWLNRTGSRNQRIGHLEAVGLLRLELDYL